MQIWADGLAVASAAFLPSITVMAEDLNTTPAMINYTVAIFIVAVGVAPLIWSPLSGFYGRKMVYLMSMPIMVRMKGEWADGRLWRLLVWRKVIPLHRSLELVFCKALVVLPSCLLAPELWEISTGRRRGRTPWLGSTAVSSSVQAAHLSLRVCSQSTLRLHGVRRSISCAHAPPSLSG